MSIQRTKTVDVIETEVTDRYQVALTVRDMEMMPLEVVIDMDPDEAISLADEIFEAATEAKNKRLADERQARTVTHGFDMASIARAAGLDAPRVGGPLCRECTEGKHGACNGVRLVESGDEVLERECFCDDDAHKAVS